MFRATPVLNIPIHRKWEEKQKELHKVKIRNAKSCVDHRNMLENRQARFGANSKKE
jgi:hypothetical protein